MATGPALSCPPPRFLSPRTRTGQKRKKCEEDERRPAFSSPCSRILPEKDWRGSAPRKKASGLCAAIALVSEETLSSAVTRFDRGGGKRAALSQSFVLALFLLLLLLLLSPLSHHLGVGRNGFHLLRLSTIFFSSANPGRIYFSSWGGTCRIYHYTLTIILAP